MNEDQYNAYLAENKSVPKCMRLLTSGVKRLQLGLDGPVEKHALYARCVPANHGRLVDSVQDSGNRREEIWL